MSAIQARKSGPVFVGKYYRVIFAYNFFCSKNPVEHFIPKCYIVNEEGEVQ